MMNRRYEDLFTSIEAKSITNFVSDYLANMKGKQVNILDVIAQLSFEDRYIIAKFADEFWILQMRNYEDLSDFFRNKIEPNDRAMLYKYFIPKEDYEATGSKDPYGTIMRMLLIGIRNTSYFRVEENDIFNILISITTRYNFYITEYYIEYINNVAEELFSKEGPLCNAVMTTNHLRKFSRIYYDFINKSRKKVGIYNLSKPMTDREINYIKNASYKAIGARFNIKGDPNAMINRLDIFDKYALLVADHTREDEIPILKRYLDLLAGKYHIFALYKVKKEIGMKEYFNYMTILALKWDVKISLPEGIINPSDHNYYSIHEQFSASNSWLKYFTEARDVIREILKEIDVIQSEWENYYQLCKAASSSTVKALTEKQKELNRERNYKKSLKRLQEMFEKAKETKTQINMFYKDEHKYYDDLNNIREKEPEFYEEIIEYQTAKGKRKYISLLYFLCGVGKFIQEKKFKITIPELYLEFPKINLLKYAEDANRFFSNKKMKDLFTKEEQEQLRVFRNWVSKKKVALYPKPKDYFMDGFQSFNGVEATYEDKEKALEMTRELCNSNILSVYNYYLRQIVERKETD